MFKIIERTLAGLFMVSTAVVFVVGAITLLLSALFGPALLVGITDDGGYYWFYIVPLLFVCYIVGEDLT